MKKLIILRGLPGSGKTVLAKQLQHTNITSQGDPTICSADRYFETPLGTYHFSQKELPLAHLQCRYNCERAMIQEKELIIIDNCNIRQKHFKPYMRMAQYYGYEVEILQTNTAWANSPDKCFEKCQHGVPLATIKRMALQWEHLDNSKKEKA